MKKWGQIAVFQDLLARFEISRSPAYSSGMFRIGQSLGKGAFGRVFEFIPAGDPPESTLALVAKFPRFFHAHPSAPGFGFLDIHSLLRAVLTLVVEADSLRAASGSGVAPKLYAMHFKPGDQGDPWPFPYLVESRVPGSPMGGLSVAHAIALGRAIQRLHAEGVAHLDLNPENILLSGDSEASAKAELIDFGSASSLNNPRPREATGHFISPDWQVNGFQYLPLTQRDEASFQILLSRRLSTVGLTEDEKTWVRRLLLRTDRDAQETRYFDRPTTPTSLADLLAQLERIQARMEKELNGASRSWEKQPATLISWLKERLDELEWREDLLENRTAEEWWKTAVEERIRHTRISREELIEAIDLELNALGYVDPRVGIFALDMVHLLAYRPNHPRLKMTIPVMFQSLNDLANALRELGDAHAFDRRSENDPADLTLKTLPDIHVNPWPGSSRAGREKILTLVDSSIRPEIHARDVLINLDVGGSDSPQFPSRLVEEVEGLFPELRRPGILRQRWRGMLWRFFRYALRSTELASPPASPLPRPLFQPQTRAESPAHILETAFQKSMENTERSSSKPGKGDDYETFKVVYRPSPGRNYATPWDVLVDELYTLDTNERDRDVLFEVVMNPDGHWLAIFPVSGGSDPAPPLYFDLTPYRLDLGAINRGGLERLHAVREFRRQHLLDSERLRKYKQARFIEPLKVHPLFAGRTPYVEILVVHSGEKPWYDVRPFTPFWPLPRPVLSDRMYSVVIPLFPTVFNPSSDNARVTDQAYYDAILQQASPGDEGVPVVNYAGSGSDLVVLMWRLTDGFTRQVPRPMAYDKNPIALLNVEAAAQAAGFQVTTGIQPLPSRISWYLANMPFHGNGPPGLRDMTRLWDKSGRDDLSEFLAFLPEILHRGGRVVAWNSKRRDLVEKIVGAAEAQGGTVTLLETWEAAKAQVYLITPAAKTSLVLPLWNNLFGLIIFLHGKLAGKPARWGSALLRARQITSSRYFAVWAVPFLELWALPGLALWGGGSWGAIFLAALVFTALHHLRGPPGGWKALFNHPTEETKEFLRTWWKLQVRPFTRPNAWRPAWKNPGAGWVLVMQFTASVAINALAHQALPLLDLLATLDFLPVDVLGFLASGIQSWQAWAASLSSLPGGALWSFLAGPPAVTASLGHGLYNWLAGPYRLHLDPDVCLSSEDANFIAGMDELDLLESETHGLYQHIHRSLLSLSFDYAYESRLWGDPADEEDIKTFWLSNPDLPLTLDNHFRLAPGMQVGAYMLKERGASGHFGETWFAAISGREKRQVLLKLPSLRHESIDLRDLVQNLFFIWREGYVLQHLGTQDGEGLPTHQDHGFIETDEITLPYVAMGVLPGQPLSAWSRSKGSGDLGPPISLAGAAQTARILSSLHGKGWAHRDVNPNNVLWKSPRAGVVDLAHALPIHGALSTVQSFAQGVELPAYADPNPGSSPTEQDVYALARTLEDSLLIVEKQRAEKVLRQAMASHSRLTMAQFAEEMEKLSLYPPISKGNARTFPEAVILTPIKEDLIGSLLAGSARPVAWELPRMTARTFAVYPRGEKARPQDFIDFLETVLHSIGDGSLPPWPVLESFKGGLESDSPGLFKHAARELAAMHMAGEAALPPIPGPSRDAVIESAQRMDQELLIQAAFSLDGEGALAHVAVDAYDQERKALLAEQVLRAQLESSPEAENQLNIIRLDEWAEGKPDSLQARALVVAVQEALKRLTSEKGRDSRLILASATQSKEAVQKALRQFVPELELYLKKNDPRIEIVTSEDDSALTLAGKLNTTRLAQRASKSGWSPTSTRVITLDTKKVLVNPSFIIIDLSSLLKDIEAQLDKVHFLQLQA